jgi:hypothetical protein
LQTLMLISYLLCIFNLELGLFMILYVSISISYIQYREIMAAASLHSQFVYHFVKYIYNNDSARQTVNYYSQTQAVYVIV